MSKKNDNARRLRQRQKDKAKRRDTAAMEPKLVYQDVERITAEEMHKAFMPYKHYLVRRGVVVLTGYHKMKLILVSDMVSAGIPLTTPPNAILQGIVDGTYKDVAGLFLVNGWAVQFYESRETCRAIVQEHRDSGVEGIGVGTVGEMDHQLVEMGYEPETSALTQFMGQTDTAVCVLNAEDGKQEMFVKFKAPEGDTVQPAVLLSLEKSSPEEQQQEDDGPEFDTGSGWVDPE